MLHASECLRARTKDRLSKKKEPTGSAFAALLPSPLWSTRQRGLCAGLIEVASSSRIIAGDLGQPAIDA